MRHSRRIARVGVPVLIAALAVVVPASTLAVSGPPGVPPGANVPTRGDDVLEGTRAGDLIAGRGGNDTISGLAGPDFLLGQGGNDTLFGDEGRDQLFGGVGDDILEGGAANDVLVGGPGMDSLNGGDGNDRLRGGRDADTLIGGDGNDVLRAAGDGAVDTVDCGDGLDDRAFVDADDQVGDGCETVTIVPAGG